jgi:hypothetical protein
MNVKGFTSSLIPSNKCFVPILVQIDLLPVVFVGTNLLGLFRLPNQAKKRMIESGFWRKPFLRTNGSHRWKPTNLFVGGCHDVHFLSREGISVDLKSVNAKLSYFGTELSRESFVAAVAAKRKVWKKELDIMLPEIPEFDAVEDEVAGMRVILRA